LNSRSNESLKTKKKPRKQTTSAFKNLHLDSQKHTNPYRNADSKSAKRFGGRKYSKESDYLSKTFGEREIKGQLQSTKQKRKKIESNVLA